MTEEEEFEKWKEKNGKSVEYMDGHVDEKDFDDYEDDQETVYDTEEDKDEDNDKVIPEKSEDTDENSSMDEIKDLILNLSTKVDDLTQKVMDSEAEEPEEEAGTLEDAGFGDDMGDEDPFADEGEDEKEPSEGEGEGESDEGEGFDGEDPFAEEGGEPSEGEGTNEEGGEPSEGESNEGGDEEPKDYAGEDDSEGENLETRKNEAWIRAKESGLLNLSSGSLISKLFNERYYDLDDDLMVIASKKVRKAIDEAKRRFVNKAKEV